MPRAWIYVRKTRNLPGVRRVKTEEEEQEMEKCNQQCEVYSRVCGYHRPTKNWNKGKKEEFYDRKEYKVK